MNWDFNMHPYLKGSLYTMLLLISTEVLYQLIFKRHKRGAIADCRMKNDDRLSLTSLKVLFFPDKEVACRDYFLTGEGCFKDKCNFSHDSTSLSTLYKYLLSCVKSIDVCVYVFTCKDLADILLMLHNRGVNVRIITDSGQLESSGSQIWRLRSEGIPVRVNKTSYFMHHKYAVIDRKILINGSFNWTHQAITGNHENLLITEDDAVTSQFLKEFTKLWEKFGNMAQ